ncbi:MAG: hypothetical protein V1860_03295, partial [bacterium]
QQKNAVAVRIMPNTEHLPAAIWYGRQGFKGSPSPLKVDGYDGIKDGNTIYVNVINITRPEIENFEYDADSGAAKPNFYTNIYGIFLNDTADNDAKNIFSQIIKNWKFNTNINIKTLNGKNQSEIDEIKEKLRRDTRRLADMAYMQWVLEQYVKTYKKYPELKAGTYISGETLSAWQSWEDGLGQELGINIPKDPINSFYPYEKCPNENSACYCNNYNPDTCWDEKTKLFNGKNNIKEGLENKDNDFAYAGENNKRKIANLNNALVYYYKAGNKGSSYEFNAKNWETPYIGGNYILKMQSEHSAENTPPIIQEAADAEINANSKKNNRNTSIRLRYKRKPNMGYDNV